MGSELVYYTKVQLHRQGIAFVGAGAIVAIQSIEAYLIDTFTLYAASGAVSFLSNIGICMLTTPSGHLSSCGRYVYALFCRRWISVVCSDDVQCSGLRQGRYGSRGCGSCFGLSRVR